MKKQFPAREGLERVFGSDEVINRVIGARLMPLGNPFVRVQICLRTRTCSPKLTLYGLAIPILGTEMEIGTVHMCFKTLWQIGCPTLPY